MQPASLHEVEFDVPDAGLTVTTFTTRADTLFGVTFLAVGAGHPDLPRLVSAVRQEEVSRFVEGLGRATGRNRPAGPGGAFTGSYGVHPATGELVPIYVAGHVVASYGTGAVMGVPAHDARDHEFAAALGLSEVVVIEPSDANAPTPWPGEGTVIGSGPFTGMDSRAARVAVAAWLEREGRGRPSVRYRLHDWLISRQRYWGPPIPIVYCEECGEVPVPEDQLPVVLPEVKEFRPTGTATSPLAAVESFVRTSCPRCNGPARRETDVSDTFLDSTATGPGIRIARPGCCPLTCTRAGSSTSSGTICTRGS